MDFRQTASQKLHFLSTGRGVAQGTAGGQFRHPSLWLRALDDDLCGGQWGFRQDQVHHIRRHAAQRRQGLISWKKFIGENYTQFFYLMFRKCYINKAKCLNNALGAVLCKNSIYYQLWGETLFHISVSPVYRNAGVQHFVYTAYAKLRYTNATNDIAVDKLVFIFDKINDFLSIFII